MRAVLGVTLAMLAACWTGGEPGPSEPAQTGPSEPVRANRAGFKIVLERTPCMGSCPIYKLVIHGDGRVEWAGHSNVLATGSRRGRVTEDELRELERTLARLKFFERDESGHLPLKPNCVTQNNTTSCSMSGSFAFCSDTSHTILTVTRRGRTHTVDNANCSDDDDLARFEDLIDRITNTKAWVGS